MENLAKKFKKFIHSKVLGRKYIRSGKCNACGNCCKGIHIKHYNHFIKDEKEFENLKCVHYFYNFLEIIETNEIGLVFACKKLDPETGKCTAYNRRALLCRTYPQEEIFMMGGIIAEECGFSFTPIESFEEVFSKVCKKKN